MNDEPETLGRDPIREVDAVADLAVLENPVREGHHGDKLILLPRGMTVHKEPDPYKLPPRVSQGITLDTAESQIAYVNRFSQPQSVLVADYTSGAITAYLDWHTDNRSEEPKARHNAHRSTFRLLPSEEYTRWDGMEGEMHSQEDFARFLEENAVDIIRPDPGTMIEIGRDLEATQGAKFQSRTRLDNGDRTFSYETETQIKGDITIPQTFTLEIPLYHGEEPVEVECLFRWKATPSGLKLGFVWRRTEYLRRAHFDQIATRIAEETGLPVFFGKAA